jgi:hypothetical protein
MLPFLHLGRRRLTALPARSEVQRPSLPRLRRPALERLEDRCVPTSSFIASSFNSISVASGSTLWFSSVASVTGVGSAPATVHIANQTISFWDSVAGNVNVSLPDADLTLTPGATSASTTFDSTSGKWSTNVPTGLAGNEFLSGYELNVPGGLYGGNIPVVWSAEFTTDTFGLSLNWQWAAAVYTSFSATYNSVGVKPVDSSSASSYLNFDHAGTPENDKTFLTGGARGSGGSNYTGTYSSSASVMPTYSPSHITLSGAVGDDGTGLGNTGIGGVTLTLTGTVNGGVPVTATTTTASDGTYSFTGLTPGTYAITFTNDPVWYIYEYANVGTVSGAANGQMASSSSITRIQLTSGLTGVDYDFAEILAGS